MMTTTTSRRHEEYMHQPAPPPPQQQQQPSRSINNNPPYGGTKNNPIIAADAARAHLKSHATSYHNTHNRRADYIYTQSRTNNARQVYYILYIYNIWVRIMACVCICLCVCEDQLLWARAVAGCWGCASALARSAVLMTIIWWWWWCAAMEPQGKRARKMYWISDFYLLVADRAHIRIVCMCVCAYILGSLIRLDMRYRWSKWWRYCSDGVYDIVVVVVVVVVTRPSHISSSTQHNQHTKNYHQ